MLVVALGEVEVEAGLGHLRARHDPQARVVPVQLHAIAAGSLRARQADRHDEGPDEPRDHPDEDLSRKVRLLDRRLDREPAGHAEAGLVEARVSGILPGVVDGIPALADAAHVHHVAVAEQELRGAALFLVDGHG
jgi:hypothetical protein